MATVLGPGRYVFGEDIPLGKYTIEAVSGSGFVQATLPDGVRLSSKFDAVESSSYYGLSLAEGAALYIYDNLHVKISKAEKIVIE